MALTRGRQYCRSPALPALLNAVLDALWFSILVKAVVTAATVIVSAVAAEKSGPFWGGLIVGLPVSAGPAYVMLAIEYDDAFLAQASLTSLAGNNGAVIFILVLVYIAPRMSLLPSLFLATAAWIVVAFLVRAIEWTLPMAIVIGTVVLAATLWLTRDVQPGPPTGRTIRPRWYHLPARAAAVGFFVAGVVTLGNVIGPEATGILSVYPVTLTSLLVLVMPRLGGQTTAALMAGIVRSMVGFALGFIVIYLTVIPWGAALSLSAGLAVMLVWAAFRLAHHSWSQRRTAS